MAVALPLITSTSSSSVNRILSSKYRPTTAPKTNITERTFSKQSTISLGNRTINAKFVVDWANPSSVLVNETKQSQTLQDAFKKFRDNKMNEMRLEQHMKIHQQRKIKIRRSDPERMKRLRFKFIEQAKKYIGVPYARKYFEFGTPEYESTLFLDCCGLVRRVMYDLAKDFGFVIGPWNQAYMYDTLPKTIFHLNDIQPGDLVFISAIYYNTKMKKQRHNLTHVEIFLGEGEKTIGARWNNGKVQIFDSYKFEAKSYHSPTYIIKSIDPWLKGICESCCSEHSWRRRRPLNPNKKSVFYSSKQTDHNGATKRRKKHRRSKSRNTTTVSASSSSSVGSKTSTAKRRRRRQRRKTRSRNRKSATTVTNSIPEHVNEQRPLSNNDDSESMSGDSDNDTTFKNDLSKVNCLAQQQCDDEDSMNEALNAETIDEEYLCKNISNIQIHNS